MERIVHCGAVFPVLSFIDDIPVPSPVFVLPYPIREVASESTTAG